MEVKSNLYNVFYPTVPIDTNCTADNTWTSTLPNGVSKDTMNELCKNKRTYDKLMNVEKPYKGEDERYANMMSKYNTEILNAFNLGIGIIAGSIFIYRL